MKSKSSLQSVVLSFAFWASFAVTVPAEDKVLFESLKLGNTVLKNVRVGNATPTHVTILYDGGGTKLKRQDLPTELKALYPYDAKEAAEYERQQAADREQRSKEAKARQEQANREIRASLLSQQQATKTRIEALEKELHQLEKEMKPMKAKAAGKPRSAARAELDAARDKQQSLMHRIGEQKKLLETITKQIDQHP